MFKFVLVVSLIFLLDRVNGGAINIIGGGPTTKGEFPWMVSIQYNQIGGLKPICGGVIVNNTHVLTSAACADFERRDLLLLAGAHNLKIEETSWQRRVPVSTYMHPEYQNNENIIRHDLAMLEVSPPFNFGPYVQPIPLPLEGHDASGYCWIAGWGQTAHAASSDTLLKAQLPIVNRTACSAIYRDLIDSKNQICAGFPQGGVDVCIGDTGGPLMCQDLGYLYVAGIASWGYKCAEPNFPGVYTDIAYYTKTLSPTLRKIVY